MKRLIATIVLILPVQMALGDQHNVPDAVTADPDHYTVEYENDVIRVLRIKYGSGETSTKHKHPANCAIHLASTTWSMVAGDGEVTENTTEVGSVECVDAETHTPTNVGDGTGELILVEIKDQGEYQR